MDASAKSTEAVKLSELRVLAEEFCLYLKPVARVNLTVQLPTLHDASGQVRSITIWEIVEKLRQLCPGILSPPTVIRVVRTTLEFVRLLAELESKADVKRVVTSLDSQYIKLSGFPQNLHVRASEAPADCPRRHDWEAFFRDADHMDETKPGERPDTLVLSGLPIRWFSHSHPSHQSKAMSDRPNPEVVKSAFQHFGTVRCVDIPMLDPVQNPSCIDKYLEQLNGIVGDCSLSSAVSVVSEPCRNDEVGGFGKIGPDTISIVSDDIHSLSEVPDKLLNTALTPLTFTAYVQFNDYMGFIKAMDALRGQKLVYAPPQSNKTCSSDSSLNSKLYFTAEIKVDFDRTKHLSKTSVHLRQSERNRLVQVAQRRLAEALAAAQADERQRRLSEDAKRKVEERRWAEALALEAQKNARLAVRAERKKQRAIERCKRVKDALIRQKIMLDEKRRLLAIRRVEAIRLITFLLSRIQSRHDTLVARRRAGRLARAEQEAAQAEAAAALVVTSKINQSRHKPLDLRDSPESSRESPSNIRLSEPTNQSITEAIPIPYSEQDRMLQQLLERRERHLRELLLKKRSSVTQRQSARSVPNPSFIMTRNWGKHFLHIRDTNREFVSKRR